MRIKACRRERLQYLRSFVGFRKVCSDWRGSRFAAALRSGIVRLVPAAAGLGCLVDGDDVVAVRTGTQITDLKVGDHACLTFGEAEERLDLTAAFVRDGLAGGLKVVWLSDAPTPQVLAALTRRGIAARRAAMAGQMVAASADSLLPGQAFAAEHAMAWLAWQVAASQGEGYPGLRIVMDMSWALAGAGTGQLPGFEESITAALAGTRVSVLCQYERERFDPVTLASVPAFHTRLVAAETHHHDAKLRIRRQYAPPGIWLAGQIDQSAADALAIGLAGAIRAGGDLTVNMTSLSFIDASCVRMILHAARSLPAPRRAELWCHPAVTASFVLLGATRIPQVSLVSAHDD